jgi:hypothetical protein
MVGGHLLDGDDHLGHILPKVMELCVDVLGPWAHFGQANQLTSAGVVTEELTKYLGLQGCHWGAISNSLLEKIDDRNDILEGFGAGIVLGFCG